MIGGLDHYGSQPFIYSTTERYQESKYCSKYTLAIGCCQSLTVCIQDQSILRLDGNSLHQA